jgi:uncharacterized protein YfaS (alpha-2-macroglobulin family)
MARGLLPPGTFVLSDPDLAPAVPLAPLLASDRPEGFALLEPSGEVVNVPRGTTLRLRFNRPMVEGREVDRALPSPPWTLDPAVPGHARWSSRSTLEFLPDPGAWDRDHEATLALSGALRSLAGEALEAPPSIRVVFHGGAQFVYPSQRRVLPGEPLPLYFNGPVNAASLPRQLLTYEIGGGRRSLGFTLLARGRDADGRSRVDLRPDRVLEPGTRIAVAMNPSLFGPWSDGSAPGVVEYELTPRPHIEGIGCDTDADSADDCSFQGPPGQVVDIAEELRLLATTSPRQPLPQGAVQVVPAVPGLTLGARGRVLTVRADWAPGQVYELRLGALPDADGTVLARPGPLAVRSAGHAPAVVAPEGRFTFERDAVAALPFAAIHADRAVVEYAPLDPQNDVLRAVDRFYTPGGGEPVPWQPTALAPLVPSARANRWARGSFAWRAEGRGGDLALVRFNPDSAAEHPEVRMALVQRTDLGASAVALPTGLAVWVTSLAQARAVPGAEVTVADAADPLHPLGTARSDDRGVAWIATGSLPNDRPVVVRVEQGGQRSLTFVDARTSVGPSALGLDAGEAPTSSDLVATLFTDRGAYRPGEVVHAKAVLRLLRGDDLRALRRGRVRFVLQDPTGGDGPQTVLGGLTAFGTSWAEFTLPTDAPAGDYTLVLQRLGGNTPLATARVAVAEFRPPALRADLEVPAVDHVSGAALTVGVRGAWLHGAPVRAGSARWSLVRAPTESVPPGNVGYTFSAVDATAPHGTAQSGELSLDGDGRAALSAAVTSSGAGRESLRLEVTVQDRAGQSVAATRSVVLYPSDFEVGVREGPSWVDPGATLEVDARVVRHDGTPASGRRVEARIVREGWHSWWEWNAHARDDEAGAQGGFQPRQAARREVVHTCIAQSGAEPTRCAFAPSRPGTYVLEAVSADDRGRVSIASRRVYVAAPGEHPDRDPPGATVRVTPSRPRWTVGETCRVAFESPFPAGEALVLVSREGVLHAQTVPLRAGGTVVQFPVTRQMVPNAFVQVVLVRPRTGPLGATPDIDAPDLRFGAAEVTVRPPRSPLTVTLRAPERAMPDGDVPVDVTVTDEDGQGVVSEVALYAVDEGTLRLTGYTTPDPVRGLFPRRPPLFSLEDLRRTLVSRIEFPALPGPSGDGTEDTEDSLLRDARERFEPTPLWLPRLVTDAQGRAHASFHLPDRPTEYRLMAVAVDPGVRAGQTSTQLLATRPVVLRAEPPAHLLDGDQFEAAVFASNTTDAAVDATVSVLGTHHTVHLPPSGEVRVSERITAHTGTLPLRYEARTSEGVVRIERTVVVLPRARAMNAAAFGTLRGPRTLPVGLTGPALPGATLTLSLAAHPYLGLEDSAAGLEDDTPEGVEGVVSALLTWTALARLRDAPGPHRWSAGELRARGESAARRLAGLQAPGGWYGAWGPMDYADAYTSTYALHALLRARALGWEVPAATLSRLTAWLTTEVERVSAASLSSWSVEQHARALRVVAEAGRRNDARVSDLYDLRARLPLFAAAELAAAMAPSDRRRDALLVDVSRAARSLVEHPDGTSGPAAGPWWFDSQTRTLASLLETSSATPSLGDPGVYATLLLNNRALPSGSWGSTHDTALALDALASHVAALHLSEEPLDAQVTLDGEALVPTARDRSGVVFTLPASRLVGRAGQLRIAAGRVVHAAFRARWWVPLGPTDTIARGRDLAVHRSYETEAGLPLPDGAQVHLGDLVRVRVFVYAEHEPPAFLRLRDLLPGGFEPMNAALDATPESTLDALLGRGPDDDFIDPRGFHARRSLGTITHHALGLGRATWALDHLPSGLQEYTYGMRATTVGTFTAPPARMEALHALETRARSTVHTLVVVP